MVDVAFQYIFECKCKELIFNAVNYLKWIYLHFLKFELEYAFSTRQIERKIFFYTRR